MTQYQRARTRIGRLLNAWWVWPVIAGFIIGFALYGASDARADGVLDRAEADYAITYGPTVMARAGRWMFARALWGDDDMKMAVAQRIENDELHVYNHVAADLGYMA